MRRKRNRLRPLETVLHVCRGPSNRIHRPWIDRLLLARPMIVARNLTSVRTGIYDLRIGRVGRNVSALAASHVVPIWTIDSPSRAGARNRHRRIVLLCSIDVIRKAVVGGHVVELRRGLVIKGAARFTTVD